MHGKRIGALLAAAALAATLGACSSSGNNGGAGAAGGSGGGAGATAGGSGKTVTVSIGLSSLNASHMWEFIARDEKIFEKYGVNLKLVIFQGAAQVLPSLLGGSTNVSEPSAPQAVEAMQKQPGLKIMFGSLMGSPLSIVAKKGIKSLADLKGKKISVNSAGSSSDYYSAVAYLTAKGINPNDVHFVTGGATSARVSALLSGAVDAVLCSPPDIQRLTKAGDKVLGNVNDIPNERNALAYVGLVKSSWMQSDRDAALRFVEGFQATQLFIRNPANRTKVVADIQKELSTDAAGASEVYDYFVKQAESNLDPTGAVTSNSLALALKDAQVKPAVPDNKLASFYDNSLVQEAAKVTGAK